MAAGATLLIAYSKQRHRGSRYHARLDIVQEPNVRHPASFPAQCAGHQRGFQAANGDWPLTAGPRCVFQGFHQRLSSVLLIGACWGRWTWTPGSGSNREHLIVLSCIYLRRPPTRDITLECTPRSGQTADRVACQRADSRLPSLAPKWVHGRLPRCAETATLVYEALGATCSNHQGDYPPPSPTSPDDAY